MRLAVKFNLIVIGVLALGFAFTGLVSYSILQDNARREVVERAGIMLEAALAVRGYTISEIRPLVASQNSRKFLPQQVPAYAATQTFSRLRESHKEYTYREATLNPTNPLNRSVEWESDVIQEFRNNRERHEVIGVRETPTGTSLFLARPIEIGDPACLVCHSTPRAAPKTLLARYGRNNGFGWQLHEIVGAQIVSVPMSLPVEQANRTFVTFMGAVGAVFIAIIVVLNLLLRYAIIKPVTMMSRIADELSRGKTDAAEFPEGGNDEIRILGASFNRMRRGLERAMKMLEQ